MSLQMFQELLSRAEARGSRSTALRSLHWGIGIVLSAILAVGLKIPEQKIILYMLIGTFILLVLLFVGAYVFFLFRNPDALRTENFLIRKMEIERGILGDNIHGELKGQKNFEKLPATDPINGEISDA